MDARTELADKVGVLIQPMDELNSLTTQCSDLNAQLSALKRDMGAQEQWMEKAKPYIYSGLALGVLVFLSVVGYAAIMV